jgi:hypothetical protein
VREIQTRGLLRRRVTRSGEGGLGRDTLGSGTGSWSAAGESGGQEGSRVEGRAGTLGSWTGAGSTGASLDNSRGELRGVLGLGKGSESGTGVGGLMARRRMLAIFAYAFRTGEPKDRG